MPTKVRGRSCNRQFNVLLRSVKRVSDAQESLRVQFVEHKCMPRMSARA